MRAVSFVPLVFSLLLCQCAQADFANLVQFTNSFGDSQASKIADSIASISDDSLELTPDDLDWEIMKMMDGDMQEGTDTQTTQTTQTTEGVCPDLIDSVNKNCHDAEPNECPVGDYECCGDFAAASAACDLSEIKTDQFSACEVTTVADYYTALCSPKIEAVVTLALTPEQVTTGVKTAIRVTIAQKVGVDTKFVRIINIIFYNTKASRAEFITQVAVQGDVATKAAELEAVTPEELATSLNENFAAQGESVTVTAEDIQIKAESVDPSSASPSTTPSRTASTSLSATRTRSPTPSVTASPSNTPSPTPSRTSSPSVTPSPSRSPPPSPSTGTLASPSNSPSPTSENVLQSSSTRSFVSLGALFVAGLALLL